MPTQLHLPLPPSAQIDDVYRRLGTGDLTVGDLIQLLSQSHIDQTKDIRAGNEIFNGLCIKGIFKYTDPEYVQLDIHNMPDYTDQIRRLNEEIYDLKRRLDNCDEDYDGLGWGQNK